MMKCRAMVVGGGYKESIDLQFDNSEVRNFEVPNYGRSVLMDPGTQRVANLEAAKLGFRYQLVKWTVLGSNTSPSMTLCDLTLSRVGFFRAQGYFKVI